MQVVGIDNGVSGSIGVIVDEKTGFYLTPTKKFKRGKHNFKRIDWDALCRILRGYWFVEGDRAFLERAMINPTRMLASQSAISAQEAIRISLEESCLQYEEIDSKSWQKELLPNVHGKELKRASMELGCKLYPAHKQLIQKHGDADGLLIAHWAKGKYDKQGT